MPGVNSSHVAVRGSHGTLKGHRGRDKFVLSGQGKMIAACEDGGGGKCKLIMLEPNCGITTKECKGMDTTLASPVSMDPIQDQD